MPQKEEMFVWIFILQGSSFAKIFMNLWVRVEIMNGDVFLLIILDEIVKKSREEQKRRKVRGDHKFENKVRFILVFLRDH